MLTRQAKEQERLKQEAINNRKRSSRIATRELAKEEEMRREQAQREMEERMEALRQEQYKKEKEEAEHLAREQAREARLREREERIAAREAAVIARAQAEAAEKERAERKRERRKRRRDGEEVESSSDEGETPSRSRTQPQTPAKSRASSVKDDSNGQSWELKCEICKLHGWNLNDDSDVVCCDDCGRWQHVKCHDRQDIAAGRGIRNWDKVDFCCQECEQRKNKRPRVEEAPRPQPPTAQANGSASHPQPAPPAHPTQSGMERRVSGPHYPAPQHAQHPHAPPAHHGYRQPAPVVVPHPSQHPQSLNGHVAQPQMPNPPLHHAAYQTVPHAQHAQHHPYAHPHQAYHRAPEQIAREPHVSQSYSSPPTDHRRPDYHQALNGDPHRREAYPRPEYHRPEYHPHPYPPPREYVPGHNAYPYVREPQFAHSPSHPTQLQSHPYPATGPYPRPPPSEQQYVPRGVQPTPHAAVMGNAKPAEQLSPSKEQRPLG